MSDTPLPKMTRKQRLWLEHYLQSWNATAAARHAGYAHPTVQGSQLLAKLNVQVEERISQAAMGANEVLKRLADQGRINIADFIQQATMPLFDKEGNQTGEIQVFELDWEFLQAHGHLVKAITPTQYGPKLELHDGQAALVHIGKHLRLFTEQVDVTSGGKPIKGYVGVSPDDWDVSESDDNPA